MLRSETSMRLATLMSSWSDRSATGLGREEAADQAGYDVERHDQDDEYERCRPGAVEESLGRGPRLGELVVREHGQGRHAPVERVEIRRGDQADRHQQRGGLADDAGDRQ